VESVVKGREPYECGVSAFIRPCIIHSNNQFSFSVALMSSQSHSMPFYRD